MTAPHTDTLRPVEGAYSWPVRPHDATQSCPRNGRWVHRPLSRTAHATPGAKGAAVNAWDPVPFSGPQGPLFHRSGQSLTKQAVGKLRGSVRILCSQATRGSDLMYKVPSGVKRSRISGGNNSIGPSWGLGGGSSPPTPPCPLAPSPHHQPEPKAVAGRGSHAAGRKGNRPWGARAVSAADPNQPCQRHALPLESLNSDPHETPAPQRLQVGK